jgi:hypothetical protein
MEMPEDFAAADGSVSRFWADGDGGLVGFFEEGFRYDDNNIISENGRTVFLLQKADGGNRGRYNLRQVDTERDALVSVDGNTGEANTLYQTKDNTERIIGYEGGWIYLFREKEKSVYRREEKTGEVSMFAELDAWHNYAFELCGEMLMVWGSDGEADPVNFVGAYARS